jgi:hypothetical protein
MLYLLLVITKHICKFYKCLLSLKGIGLYHTKYKYNSIYLVISELEFIFDLYLIFRNIFSRNYFKRTINNIL